MEYYSDRSSEELQTMVIMFALAAAVLYGSADFLGGAASRQNRALSVASVSVPVGALVMLAAALAASGPAPTAGLGWALAAGAFGAIGLLLLSSGSAAGRLGVVAPVSAPVRPVLRLGGAGAMGEQLGGLVSGGAAVCLVAPVLVSLERRPPDGVPAPPPRGGFLGQQPAL